MSKILIVEDEAGIARFVELELKYEGYEVEVADNGTDGIDKARTCGADLIVLDVMLPGMSGIEICKTLREEGNNIPIIMLTAKDDISDKVAGLDNGADDYMTKPFAIEELLARIRVAIGRAEKTKEKQAVGGDIISLGKLMINRTNHTVSYAGEEIPLTQKEFDLLAYLADHRGEAISREALLSEVWEYEYMGDTNVVDVYIRYLRQKIDEKYGDKFISTVRGVGYMIK